MLAKDRRRFLVLVNRDIGQPIKLRITLDSAAEARRVEKDGTLRAFSGEIFEIEVAPSDVMILNWASG